jgi:hypothetical protein
MTITSTTTSYVTATSIYYSLRQSSSVSSIIVAVEVLNLTKIVNNKETIDTDQFNKAVYLPLVIIVVALLSAFILTLCGCFHVRKSGRQPQGPRNAD